MIVRVTLQEKEINMKNENLYIAYKSLVLKILSIFREEYTHGGAHNFRGNYSSSWGKRDNTYSKEIEYKIIWFLVFHKYKEEIIASDEYLKVQEEINNDEDISPQVDTLVGCYFGASRVESFNLSTHLTYQFLDNTSILEYDDTTFNEAYKTLEDDIYSSTIEYEEITPIFGLKMYTEEILLSQNVSIIKMNDSQIKEFLRLGIIIGNNHGGSDFIHNIYEYAIKVSCKTPKVIGERESHVKPESCKVQANFHKQILKALQIFQPGKIYPIATIGKSNSYFMAGTAYNQAVLLKPFASTEYILSTEQVDTLQNFYKKYSLVDLEKHSYLSLAIRRLSQSYERDSEEDRMIDLMISAEALFLGSDSDKYTGELKYKFSQRAAFYIGENKEEIKNINQFMRDAYSIRSKIVHGNVPSMPKCNGNEQTMQNFNDTLLGYIRETVKNMIDTASRHSGIVKRINWDEIIYR
jgi:hypothetical protein